MVGTQSTAAIGKGGYKRWEKEDIREGERRGWWIGDCGTRGVRVGLVGMGDAGEEPHGHSTPCPPPPTHCPRKRPPARRHFCFYFLLTIYLPVVGLSRYNPVCCFYCLHFFYFFF